MFSMGPMTLIGWVLLTLGGLTGTPEAIDYEVTPVVHETGLDGVDITLTFRGDLDGRTDVRLPESWAGADRLDRSVDDVRVEGARLHRRGSRLRLRHRGGASIRLTYRVHQDYAGPPRVGFDRPYRPSTLRDGFTLIGWTVFARVTDRGDLPVTFRWGRVARGWGVASDLDHRIGRAIDFDALADSVMVGGPGLRVVERETPDGTVRVAVHGGWRFSADALADRYERVVEASSAFWDEGRQPYFLALTPLTGPPGTSAQAGLGLGDGLAVWLTTDQTLDEADHVLVHEQQHAWLPDRVGGLAEGHAEVLDFWFSEGFTDFYALRTELRLGLNSPEDHIAALDRALALQAATPARLGNAEIARAFFSDPGVAGVPYHRGLLLALMLDGRLRIGSDGAENLDDVILAMRDGQGSAPQRLIQAYGEIGAGDLRPDLHHHVDLGLPIRLSQITFGDCVRVIEGHDRQHLEPGPGLSGESRKVCIDRLAGL